MPELSCRLAPTASVDDEMVLDIKIIGEKNIRFLISEIKNHSLYEELIKKKNTFKQVAKSSKTQMTFPASLT